MLLAPQRWGCLGTGRGCVWQPGHVSPSKSFKSSRVPLVLCFHGGHHKAPSLPKQSSLWFLCITSRKSVLCLGLELRFMAQDYGWTHSCDELFKDRFLNQPFLTNIALQQNVSTSKSWNEKAFAFPSFLCPQEFSYVLIIKWLFLLHLGSECLFHKAYALQLSSTHPKIRSLCFSCLDLSQGPNFKPHWTGPQVGNAWPLSEAMGSVGVSENQLLEPLLPLSCLSPDPLCSFLSNQTGRHRSHTYTLSGRRKNINVSLSLCLKVEPFKEMSPHQEEEKCFS